MTFKYFTSAYILVRLYIARQYLQTVLSVFFLFVSNVIFKHLIIYSIMFYQATEVIFFVKLFF